jgi:hypothetical protein
MAELAKRRIAECGKIRLVERDRDDPSVITCTIVFRQQFYGSEFQKLCKAIENDAPVDLYEEVTVQDARDEKIAGLEKQPETLRAERRKLGGTP